MNNLVHTKCVGCEADDKYLLSTVTEMGRVKEPETGDTFDSYECRCGVEERLVYKRTSLDIVSACR